MKVVGVIPAKGTSTRVKGKNFREILGLPMYLWAANNLNKVLNRKDIYIDSENEEILYVCNELGFGIIERPKELATNNTDGNQLLLWELSQVDSDIYIQHLPPMLFVKKSTLEKMLDGVKNEYDSSTVVHKQKIYMWNSEGNPLYDINNIPNSFDLPDIISETMGLYVSKKKSILENSVRVSGNILLVDVDVIESTDINYEDDYLMSKSIANGLPYDSEYLEGVLELSKEYKKIKYG